MAIQYVTLIILIVAGQQDCITTLATTLATSLATTIPEGTAGAEI